MKYTIQRPIVEWAEVVIEDADNLEHALELADEQFENGDFVSVEMSWGVDFERYWAQDQNGDEFTETHHSAPAN
jgi:hypothetical protein